MSDNNKGILLETGTNEFEIIEFSMGEVTYGINVAKVREVIGPAPVTKLANAHPFIDGVLSLRGKVMPQINLAKCLDSQEPDDYRLIVCEINKVHAAFKVKNVERIHRISWADMNPPPPFAGAESIVGIVKMQERLILLLDFERILAEVNPEINRKLSHVPESEADLLKARAAKTILIAEDSKLLRDLLLNTLGTAGFHVISTENGQLAWEKLNELGAAADLVITDIEMPQMDGHHFTKLIKTNDKFKHLPVIIFSSLINDEMRQKGELLGADAQITKPEIGQLIDVIDQKLFKM